MSRTDQGGAKSVQRALAILAALAELDSAAGIVEISERVALPVSTVHRLLRTLVNEGFAAQHEETGHYGVGVRAFEVGSAFQKQTRLGDVMRPVLRQLAAQLEETTKLAVRDGSYAVYLDDVEWDPVIKLFSRPGTRVPLYCSASGHVLLAELPRDSVERILADSSLSPRTPTTITEMEGWHRALAFVRSQGYAVSDQELMVGVRGIAVPVRNALGEVAAAVSVAAPAFRLDDDRVAQFLPPLKRASATISRRLGWRS